MHVRTYKRKPVVHRIATPSKCRYCGEPIQWCPVVEVLGDCHDQRKRLLLNENATIHKCERKTERGRNTGV